MLRNRSFKRYVRDWTTKLGRAIHVLPSRTETAMPWSRHGDGGVLWSCERVAARIQNGSVMGLGLGWV
jgi:hypothetical protein